MAATRHEAWGNAREPDGGNAVTPWVYSLRSKYCRNNVDSENCRR
jgi:hypothetical protein